ncbi:hypothetical protein ACFVLG_30430 [Streptomyces rochei]|uniref:hypothetical protein n=1 Tax=Streptomyces rochei TaxID=1928 RepID=UPI00369C07EF
MHDHDQDQDDGAARGGQALAVTLGLLLLIGGVLMTDAVAGPFVAFGVFAVPVVAAYAVCPGGTVRAALRTAALRREVRRLLRDA